MLMVRAHLTAYLSGIKDGFAQPHDLSASTNVDHLTDALPNAQEVLDSGINLGQFLRAGRASQSAQEGYSMIPARPTVTG